MSTRYRHSYALIGVLIAAGVLTLGLVGCGSSSSTEAGQTTPSTSSASTADPVAAASKLVATYTDTPVTWAGPTTPVPFAKGKRIVMVNINAATQTSKELIAAFKEAGSLGGWDLQVIDAKGEISKVNAGIDTALQLDPDGILLVGIGANQIEPALAKVKKAGIPVVSTLSNNSPENLNNPALSHVVNERRAEQGEALTALIVKDFDGDAKIGIFTLSHPLIGEGADGIKKYIADNGGGEIVATQFFTFADLGAPSLGQKAVALLQGNPDITALAVGWDTPAADIVPAIQQAGLGDKVKVYSFEGELRNLELIRAGQVQVADVVQPIAWRYWAAVDAFNRIFAGQPLQDDGVPFRLITAANLPPKGESFTGGFDFEAEYKRLWGLSE